MKERKPLTKAQKDLITDNMGYIKWYFNRHNIYDEDVQQDLLCALCMFIHLYDPSRGKITTFIDVVFSCKRIKIYNHDNTLSRKLEKNAIRLNDIVCDDGGNMLTVEDIIADTRINLDELENKSFYKTILKDGRFNKNQLKILIAYFQTGNMTEVAKMYNCSKQHVSQTIQRAKKILLSNKGVLQYKSLQ